MLVNYATEPKGLHNNPKKMLNTHCNVIIPANVTGYDNKIQLIKIAAGRKQKKPETRSG
jgi:hypothetical protein